MANSSGNKKTNNRRKRPTNQQAANRQKQQATPKPAATPAAKTGTEPGAPVTRRTSKKEAAQAQAKKKQQMQLIIGGVALAVIVAAVFIFLNRPTESGVQIDYSGLEVAQSDFVASQGALATPDADEPLSFATGPIVGDPNAPVTMHIFSDFQCHFCLQFHDNTLPSIVDDFVKSGQVKLVYHDFPRLGTDPSIANPEDFTVELRDPNNESSISSQAAMCAGEQDEYLEMSDKLFGNYGGVQQGAYKRSNINRYAQDLNLNMDSFNECMDSARYIPAIAQSIEQGQAQGITATPMFILDNGSGDLNVIQQTAEGYTLIKKQIEVSIQTAP